MSRVVRLLLILIVPIFLAFSSGMGNPRPTSVVEEPLPFGSGERLAYEISWWGIKGGTAVLEVKGKFRMQGRDVYQLVSTAQSNDFISFFYPVDDRVESYMDATGLYSHRIKVHQKEGKRIRDKRIEFDQANHRAVLVKSDDEKVFEIPPNVQDSLSSLYYFRTMEGVAVGKSVFIDVHESEKNWQLEIKVLGKERVTTPVGTFDTLKVKALLRYEGLFMDKGDVAIWFTDDDKRVPVMMQGKIKIGKITAMLISRREGRGEIQTAGDLAGKF